MARGKKKEENLTLEERLEQALVPEEEWPYEVPGNWCWVRLKDVCIFERGITFPASAKEYEQTADNIACLRTANIQEDLDMDNLIYVDKKNMKNNKFKFVQEDDIIMSSANSRELVGKVVYVDSVPFPMTFGGFVLTIRTNQLLSKFIYYFLRLEFLLGRFMAESTQTTNIANINTTILGGYPFPIPPLSEQKCIVERIESLFYKVDEVKEKIQYVLESSENRKAAILHKAFSGELTEQWRREHKIQMNSWVHINLKQVCEVNPKKIALQNLEDDLEVSFYPMAAISEITGKVINPQLRRLKEVKTGFTSFKEGDVIFAKITPCMENGKSAVVEKLVNDIGFGSTEFYVLRCNSRLFNCYLHYIIRDRRFRDSAKEVMTGAVGQQRVPKGFLEEYLLYLPTLDEQKEIVKLLDGFIKREQKIEAKCKALIANIDLLKKSILSRAFRGELGTNNPDEESAIELLKTIL